MIERHRDGCNNSDIRIYRPDKDGVLRLKRIIRMQLPDTLKRARVYLSRSDDCETEMFICTICNMEFERRIVGKMAKQVCRTCQYIKRKERERIRRAVVNG